MPLSLGQIEVKAIVDWNVEWKKGCEHVVDGKPCQNHMVEVHKNPIRRGMIVRVDGDPHQEQVEGIWVTFGDDIGKDKIEISGVTVPCLKVPAREMNLAYSAGTKIADEAWKRTFKVPTQVGKIFESRTAKGRKAPILDKLQLTGVPTQGPITDGPGAVREKDDE